MRTIALVNQKGGVGKSTTAVNLSAGLARLGQRVLLIDLDPQAHATLALGLDPKKLEKTVYTVLAGQASAKDVIRPVSERLSILPSNVHLAGGEAELSMLPEPAFVLKRAMEGIDPGDYDYALVDCPPQLGFLNVNCLIWVREVFIPVTCEFYALHGLSLLMDTVERVKAKLNPDLRISGVITCQVHPRRAITRDILSELEKHFPGRVLQTRVRVNVRLVEAPSHGKSIFDYAPDSHGAADYLSLAREMLGPTSSLETSMPGTAVAAEPSTPDSMAEPAVVTVEGDASPSVPASETVDPALVVEETSAAAAHEVPSADSEPVEAGVSGEAMPAEDPPVVSELENPVRAAEETPVATEAEASAVDGAPAMAEAPAVEIPPAEPPVAAETADPIPVAEEAPVAGAPSDLPAEPAPAVAEAPYVEMPPGAPLTTPVPSTASEVSPAPSGVTGVTTPYAQMLGLGDLKPIVVARPGSPPPAAPDRQKGRFGSRFLGKIMGRKS